MYATLELIDTMRRLSPPNSTEIDTAVIARVLDEFAGRMQTWTSVEKVAEEADNTKAVILYGSHYA